MTTDNKNKPNRTETAELRRGTFGSPSDAPRDYFIGPSWQTVVDRETGEPLDRFFYEGDGLGANGDAFDAEAIAAALIELESCEGGSEFRMKYLLIADYRFVGTRKQTPEAHPVLGSYDASTGGFYFFESDPRARSARAMAAANRARVLADLYLQQEPTVDAAEHRATLRELEITRGTLGFFVSTLRGMVRLHEKRVQAPPAEHPVELLRQIARLVAGE